MVVITQYETPIPPTFKGWINSDSYLAENIYQNE